TPLFFSLVRPRPRSTLFPYTTLFRSRVSSDEEGYPEKSSAHCAVKRVINCGKESCSAGLFMTAPQLDQRALDDMITFPVKAVSARPYWSASPLHARSPVKVTSVDADADLIAWARLQASK